MKPLLLVTLFFALQLSGLKAYAFTGRQHTAKTETAKVKQGVNHHELTAETGAEIHLPVLQMSVLADGCLTAGDRLNVQQVTAVYLNRRLTVPQSRFYRLILFPFHGFW